MRRPIFWASIAISMNSASLKPLQMIGVSFDVIAITARSSGLDPASRPKSYGRPKSRTSSTTWRCWFTLMGYTQKYLPSYEFCVMACCEGAMDFAEALAKNVAEPDQDRQADAAELQVIDQLLEVNRAIRFFGGVNLDLAVRADGKVALAPTLDLVEFTGVRHCPRIALTPCARRPAGRAHGAIINEFFTLTSPSASGRARTRSAG